MTDYRDEPPIPLEPFPVQRAESPFPPLAESVAPAPAQPDPPSDWIQSADAHDLPTRENALVALGRFAFPPAAPLDDEGAAARDRRWTSRTVITAAAFLLVFNAVSPLNWARQQPPGWVPETVRQLSEVWVDQLSVFAADQPRRGMREVWEAMRRARFIGQGAGDEAPPTG
ncbi:MAG: hypothetical protein SWI22_07610 [Pseudomonadota bacterium]|nr:hypothetical protein [Pseudomonadota bacterium]